MASTTLNIHSDRDWSYHSGTATANSDASEIFLLPTPMRTFGVQGTRVASGNFTFTLQGSLDGANFETLATCTVTGGVSNYATGIDKPVRFIRVLFTDVGAATISWHVVGTV
jgi:hypothetical protein